MKAVFYSLVIFLLLHFSFANAQCNAPRTSVPTSVCPGSTVTLSAITTNTPGIIGHGWYTAPSGGYRIQTSNSFPISDNSMWYSEVKVSSSSSVTYYVSTICSSGESVRIPVTYVAGGTSIAIQPSGSPDFVCQGSPFTLTASGGSNYQWRLNYLNASVISTATVFSPTQSGTYYLTGTNNCGVTQSKPIQVRIIPQVTSISGPTGPTSRYQGAGTSTYSASASNAGLSWYLSPSTAGTISSGVVTWNAGFSGMATVKLVATGCGGSSVTSSLNVNVIGVNCNPPAAMTTTSTCPGTTVTLGAYSISSTVTGHKWYTSPTGGTPITPTSSYAISNGWVSNMKVSSNYSVTYYVSAICNSAETSRTAVTYTAMNATNISILPSGRPDYVCNSEVGTFSLTALGGTNYQWRLNDPNSYVISTNSVIYPKQSGVYYLTGTNSCGQIQGPIPMKVVIYSGCRVGNEESAEKELVVSPNPATEGTTISYSLKEDSRVTLEMFDNQGKRINRIIDNIKQSAGQYHQYIPTGSLGSRSSFYVLKLTINDSVLVKKIIVN
jgi:hypothetical protein